jgi:2-methylcitrate dehydratase PrpD
MKAAGSSPGQRAPLVVEPLTAELARFIAGSRQVAMTDDVEQRARVVFLDTIGAVILGASLPVGVTAARALMPLAGQGDCVVVGESRSVDAASAAYLTAIQCHADEVDDSHFASLTHPASTSLPGLMALGRQRRLSAREVLGGLATAYDVQCRASLALDPRQLMNRGFMPLAICGAFGSVAGAAYALGLDADDTTVALGLVGLQAAGLWACAADGSHMAKAMMSGFPARNGVEAALLASEGFLAPTRIFEGRDGVLGAFVDDPRPGELTKDLGTRFEILGTSIKKYVCGGPIRGAVDALLAILDEQQIASGDVENIHVELAASAVAIVDNRASPAINLQHVLAVATLDRRVGLEQHRPERVSAPDTLAMKARVDLLPNDEFEKVWPSARPALVRVRTHDGTSWTKVVEHASGSPEHPLTWSEVRDKYLTITAGVVEESVAGDLADAVEEMETAGDFESLMNLLSATPIRKAG